MSHLDALEIKIRTLAYEARIIHQAEIGHRTTARIYERYGKRIGKDPRPMPATLTGDKLNRALWSAGRRAKLIARAAHIYAWLDRQALELPADADRPAKIATGRAARSRHLFQSMRDHRLGLRPEARISLLAYGFLRNRPYETMEAPNTRTDLDWDAVWKTALRFSGAPAGSVDVDLRKQFDEWKKIAEWYLRKGRKGEITRPTADAHAI